MRPLLGDGLEAAGPGRIDRHITGIHTITGKLMGKSKSVLHFPPVRSGPPPALVVKYYSMCFIIIISSSMPIRLSVMCVVCVTVCAHKKNQRKKERKEE